MEYTPALTSRPDWSQVTTVMRLVLIGESPVISPQAESPYPFTVSGSRSTQGLGYRLWHGFLNCILAVTIVVTFTWFGPSWWYSLTTSLTRLMTPTAVAPAHSSEQKWPNYFQRFNNWVGALTVTPIAGQSGQSVVEPQPTQGIPTPTPAQPPYEPPYSPDLPDGNWLAIPRIGTRSELHQGPDSATELQKGLWEVPDFGKAGSRDMPMIVAGHRYGWDWWWKTDYWKYHSFYLLPNLEVGDQIEVISDHRKWIYQVYAGEEGTEITDYSADLILYTCKDLSSPIRFFKYAKLVDPTKDSQEKN